MFLGEIIYLEFRIIEWKLHQFYTRFLLEICRVQCFLSCETFTFQKKEITKKFIWKYNVSEESSNAKI